MDFKSGMNYPAKEDKMEQEELKEKIDTIIFSHKDEIEQGWTSDTTNQILALIKEAGYVQLADDQPLEEGKSLFPPF